MSSQILIAALKKVINRDVSSVVLAALKELVLGYWYSERKDENESYLDYWTRVLKSSDEENVGEDVEDDNEYVETKVAKKERKIAPKDMQESLRNIVLKSRSPIERERAIDKVDDDFLVEQIKNPKQMQRVRLHALQFAPPESIDDIVANSDDPVIKSKAIDLCKNKDLILKYVKDTDDSSQLWKLDVRTVIDNFPHNFILGDVQDHNDFFSFMGKLESPKDIIFVLDKFFSAPDYSEFGNYGRERLLEFTLPLLQKIKDKDFCKKIISSKKLPSDKLQAYIVLLLKDDKLFIKGLLDRENIYDGTRKLILEIVDDQKLYKEEAAKAIQKLLKPDDGEDDEEDDEFKTGDYGISEKGDSKVLTLYHASFGSYLLGQIKDDKFVKDMIEKFSLSVPNVVTKLKGDDFLKKYYAKTQDAQALINIDDDEYLLNIYKTSKDADSLLKYVKNENFLIAKYQDILKRTPDTSSHHERDSWGRKRADALNNIKDQDFLIYVAKKDPSYVTRKAAIKNITDMATVEKFLLRETSKNGKKEILDVIDNQDILMRFIMKQKDPEIQRWAYEKLDVESITKLVTENFASLNVPKNYVKKMDVGTLKKLIEKNEIVAERYISLVTKDQDFILKVLREYPKLAGQVINTISNEKVLKKLLVDENALSYFNSFDKITDHALLEYILLNKDNMYVNDVSNILMQLNPSQEFLKSLIENAPSVTAKETASFITDVDFMVNIINTTSKHDLIEHLYKKVWPHIKGDLEKLKKLAKSKSVYVLEKILPSLANQDKALSQVVKSLNDIGGYGVESLIAKAISLLSDKKHIIKMLSNLSVHQMAQIDPKITHDWLLGVDDKDISFRKARALIQPNNALDVYNTAKSDTVKSAAIIEVAKNNFPESLTKDIIDSFVSGMQQTDRPYEIDKGVIKMVYDHATEKQQDMLAGYMENSQLNERHRDALHRPYLAPTKKDKKFTPLEHSVEKNPINQLFRLLIHLAR